MPRSMSPDGPSSRCGPDWMGRCPANTPGPPHLPCAPPERREPVAHQRNRNRHEAADPAKSRRCGPLPGAALWGTYSYTQTYPATGEVFPPRRLPRHHPLPAYRGPCATLMSTIDTNNLFVMQYGDAGPPRASRGEAKCTDGIGKVRQSSRDELPLPQGPQNPITTLTGKSFQDYTGDCPAQVELDVRIQRTGDLKRRDQSAWGRAKLTGFTTRCPIVVAVRKASRSSRHRAGVFLSGSIPVYSPR